MGAFQSIARPLGYRCTATEVPDAVERLLRAYLSSRNGEESLRSFFARHSDIELRSLVAGADVEPVQRDPSPGRVPAGVAG